MQELSETPRHPEDAVEDETVVEEDANNQGKDLPDSRTGVLHVMEIAYY